MGMVVAPELWEGADSTHSYPTLFSSFFLDYLRGVKKLFSINIQ